MRIEQCWQAGDEGRHSGQYTIVRLLSSDTHGLDTGRL